MTKIVSLAACAVLCAFVFAGCSKTRDEGKSADQPVAAAKPTPGEANVGEVSPYQLSGLLSHDAKVAVFDANGEQTRSKYGTIPGAKLLSHFNDYEVGELPSSKDDKLVFYCANTSCGASHASAEKAIVAGYTDVNVLPAGIKGWVDAGQNTTRVD